MERNAANIFFFLLVFKRKFVLPIFVCSLLFGYALCYSYFFRERKYTQYIYVALLFPTNVKAQLIHRSCWAKELPYLVLTMLLSLSPTSQGKPTGYMPPVALLPKTSVFIFLWVCAAWSTCKIFTDPHRDPRLLVNSQQPRYSSENS